MNLKESDFNAEKSPLGNSLWSYEQEPKTDISNKELINVTSCIYLREVKLTPISNLNAPMFLEEFILFSDHILGITLLK